MSTLTDIGQAAGALGINFGKSQVSNRDYQHQQNLLDSGNPREIARQSQFLEGLAPSQANAYNTIQDATYSEDTARQTERIQSMGEDLGMSPWELTGASGAAPLPSPTGPAAQNNNAQYMGNLTQLRSAQMQNETALRIAAMNNQTQLETTKMQTDTQRYGADVGADTTKIVANLNTANGKVAITQAELSAQQKMESMAREGLIYDQQRATQNSVYIDTARLLAELAGKTEFSIPGIYKRTQTNGAKGISAIADMQGENSTAVAKYISSMSADEFAELNKDLKHIEEFIALGVGASAGGMAKGAAGFLGDMFSTDVTKTDDNKGKSTYTQKKRRIGGIIP